MSLDRARAARHVTIRRGELGMTRQQLADRAHVDIKTIYNLESGERWPQPKTRHKIEQALGWRSGSLEAAALGREPERADDQDESEDDPKELWELAVRAIEDLTPQEREYIVTLIKALRSATEPPGAPGRRASGM